MKKVKLTLAQMQQLLSAQNLDVEVVDEADENVDIDTLIPEPEPQPTGMSEEEYKTKLKAEHGKLFGTFRSALANAFGVKTSDLEGLEPKDIAEKLKTNVATRFTHTEQELREQLEDVTNQLNAKEEEYADKFAKIEADWSSKFQLRDIQDSVTKAFNAIPRKGGDASVQAELAINRWGGKYDLKLNPITGTVDVYEKGTENLVMDGKNPMKVDTLAKNFISDLGLDVTDTSHIPPAEVVNNGGKSENFQAGAVGSGVPNNQPVASNFKDLIADVQA